MQVKSIAECSKGNILQYDGRFYVRSREVDIMESAKVNAYIMYIFEKIELLSIHAT